MERPLKNFDLDERSSETDGMLVAGLILGSFGVLTMVTGLKLEDLATKGAFETIGFGLTALGGMMSYDMVKDKLAVGRERGLRGLINSGQIIETNSVKPPVPQLGQGATRPTLLQKALLAPTVFRRSLP